MKYTRPVLYQKICQNSKSYIDEIMLEKVIYLTIS
jgi:hypothetical protein